MLNVLSTEVCWAGDLACWALMRYVGGYMRRAISVQDPQVDQQ